MADGANVEYLYIEKTNIDSTQSIMMWHEQQLIDE